ncbi:MAG TPA: pseudouridine synthase [Pelobium sp.]
MPFNKDRNSRDDKSGKDYKKSERSDTPGRSNREDNSNLPFSKFRKTDANHHGDSKSFEDKQENYRDKKPYGSRDGGPAYGKKEPYGTRNAGGNAYGDKKPYGNRNAGDAHRDKKTPYGSRTEGGDRNSYKTRDDKNTFGEKPSYRERAENGDDRKPFRDRKEFDGNKPFRPKKDEDRKPFVSSDRDFSREGRPYEKRESFGERSEYKGRDGSASRKRYDDRSNEYNDDRVKLKSNDKGAFKKIDELIRLNRFIANSGICSRRKADELISSGLIKVNDEVVTELGTKVNPQTDQVKYNGELLKREKMVYVLLNKPKDYITTTDDPQERKTVMELVSKATSERIYPVGRLDRNTTGLLLLTNDGDLADKLSHPKNSISKIYNVELNKNLTQGDFNKIAFGVELEDGLIKPDEIRYVTGGAKNEVGIQIHSGKNRIVRRIFESLGYEVVKLDRVIYANLTKKDLTRGRWRYLTEKEIIQLKHFTKGQ